MLCWALPLLSFLRAETYISNPFTPVLSKIPATQKEKIMVVMLSVNSCYPWPIPVMAGCIRSTIPFSYSEVHPQTVERRSEKDLGTKEIQCIIVTGIGDCNSGARVRAAVLKV